MKRRSTIFYWALMLVPALLLGVTMLYLLGHEQERVRSQLHDASLEQAHAVAQTLQLAVDGVCQSLATTLEGVKEEQRDLVLRQWMQGDPLVRNVFVWRSPDTLLYPDPDGPLSREEMGFVARYRPLFYGERPWRTAAPESAGPNPSTTKDFSAQIDTAQNTLLNVSKRSRTASATAYANSQKGSQPALPPPPEGEWIRWFDDNQLHMLCWRNQPGTDLYWGLELEMIVLIADLVASFPECPDQFALLLCDGSGDIVHQAGSDDTSDLTPNLRIPLAPALPHWELLAYLRPTPSYAATVWILAGTLLVLAFLAAVISGGLLLTAESRRNWREAQLKTTFVANVSHELKTPLTTIRMYSEMLQLGRVRSADKQQRYLQTVVDECGRLTRLVNNVLDFGRLEQNRRKYRIETVDLPPFTEALAETHRLRISKAGLSITTLTDPANIPVRADRDALEQVILNVIDNATKYAADGHVIELAFSCTPTHGVLQIMDRGPGIPSAHRKQIFTAFHRVDDSLTASQPGSGLGLSIARRLLDGMNGSLDYRPRPGGGALFELRLVLDTTHTPIGDTP